MSDDISILIADDHPIFRNGLRGLIENEPGMTLVGEAADGEQALQLVRKLKPNVLLLDFSMPKLGGLDVLRHLVQDRLPTQCILLTAGIDDAQITDALRLNARGVVL